MGILGILGIPVSYGGFEPLAERLALHLVARGHAVTVYGDRRYMESSEPWRGVARVAFPTPPHKVLEKLTGAALQAIDSAWRELDVVLMLGLSPIAFAWLPRLTGRRLVANVDGLEWKRRKWGPLGRNYLKLSERAAIALCHTLVADSLGMQDYYRGEYGCETVFIPYGAELEYPDPAADSAELAGIGVEPRRYVLQICRLEPENNALWAVREYREVRGELPLVVVGDAPYADVYEAELRRTADARVIFTGRLTGATLAALRRNALCYLHGHEVGGTNPSLLEALAAGNCVVALDVIFNREVIAGAGLVAGTAPGELAAMLQGLLDDPARAEGYRAGARQRIAAAYGWPSVLEAYERLLTGAA